jgi:cbb3-type cytochrome oxidase maturation protein
MNILFIIIPLSILLVIGIIAAFLWAVRSGQFDDMEGPAYRILMDDGKPVETDDKDHDEKPAKNKNTSKTGR